MNNLKEEDWPRINKAYELSKFGLIIKPRTKKVNKVFEEVAEFLQYKNPVRVANIYYRERKHDPSPIERFKTEKKLNTAVL